MIKLPKYSIDLVERYEQAIDSRLKKISNENMSKIQADIKVLFPKKYAKLPLQKIMLLKFSEIKEIMDYIIHTRENNPSIANMLEQIKDSDKRHVAYTDLIKEYERIRDYKDKNKSDKKMSIMMVEDLKISVCPYCNRDHINNRSDTKSGAELDHFYSKSTYPFFSLALYNLVPCCHNCNHIKGEREISLSPHDEIYDFERSVFDFDFLDIDSFQIRIKMSEDNQMRKNTEVMELEQSYSVNSEAIKTIVTKAKIYNSSQINEIQNLMNTAVSREERRHVGNSDYHRYVIRTIDIEKEIFGMHRENSHFLTTPLGKLNKDIMNGYLKEL